MSWRIKGQYNGLTEKDSEFLKEFNKSWERKQNGRTTTDLFEQAIIHPLKENDSRSVFEIQGTDLKPWAAIETLMISLAGSIKSYTVPREVNSRWSIRITLKTGSQVWVRFDDLNSATQAFDAIREFCFWIPNT